MSIEYRVYLLYGIKNSSLEMYAYQLGNNTYLLDPTDVKLENYVYLNIWLFTLDPMFACIKLREKYNRNRSLYFTIIN